MIERVQKLWWRAALPLTRRAGSLPVGIWFVWLCLAYAAGTFAHKLLIFTRAAEVHTVSVSEVIATWAILLIAAASLARRRLVTRMFTGMVMALLFMHCLYRGDPIGIALPVLCIPCLLANRRWFYERLPNIW